MTITESLCDPEVWRSFLAYKTDKNHLSRAEENDLEKFIEHAEYLPVVEKIVNKEAFPLPEKKLIRKIGSEKKRTVYMYPRQENYVLKLITFLLLRRYDDIFAPSLYSFRVQTGVNKAMRRVMSLPKLSEKYTYKVDISNYFNSIPVERMLEKLKPVLKDEEMIYALLERLLTEPRVIDDGEIVTEAKGVMAGTPFAVFLANVYLMDLDKACEKRGFTYARYSDDILVIADTAELREEAAGFILSELSACGLTVNPKKEMRTAPGEVWSFLGISYENGIIDISEVSKEKIKDKMRRRARAIKRWQAKKNAEAKKNGKTPVTNEQAAKAFIRAMNKKFYDPDSSHELTWSRWYFPVINTDKTLHELEEYMQQWIRYLATGKHNRSSYNFRYEDMKEIGYISLVHEYYEMKKI